MGKLPLQRVKSCLHHYAEDELWELREAIDQRLGHLLSDSSYSDPTQNMIVGMASIISVQYFEETYQPFTDARYKLRSLIEIMDALGAVFWDEALANFLNNEFEQKLSGAYYNLLSIAAGVGHDIKAASPDVILAIENRLKALHVFVQKGDSNPLREVVKIKLNVDKLFIPQMGRPPKLAKSTISLGEFGHRMLVNNSGSSGDAAEAYIKFVQSKTEANRSEGEKKGLAELLRRPKNPTTGENLTTRGEYMYDAIHRWRKAQGIIIN